MSFAALDYVVGTITVWHLVIWFAITSFMTIVTSKTGNDPLSWSNPASILWLLAMVYGLFCVTVGQIFGDKYSFFDAFPFGFLFGVGCAAVPFLFPTRVKGVRDRSSAGFGIIATLLAGLFFGTCIWLVPQVAGLGLIDFPKYAWAVQT